MTNKPTKDAGVKTPAPKSTHILRYLDKSNHEYANGPKPKSNDWYHEKYPYKNIDNAKSEIQNKKPYYINRNGELLDANDDSHWQEVTKRQDAEARAAPAKIVKTPIGNVKYIPSEQKLKIDEDTKRHVMKQEYEARKYKKPMSSSGAILREIISDDAKAAIAKQKATKPVQIDFSNNSALQDLEEFHQSRIEADARARRYHEIIKKRDDPSLHKGLAAILGSIPQDFNK